MPLRIHLENFRCHVNSTFEFPESGLIQLSGESGRGKSTVLTAICYALYGKITGRIKKPYTHGKTTSKVTLNYNGLTIVRTSRPCRVVVTFNGVTYEDDAAQSVIEKTIGMTHEEFLASSYIIQNQDVSVLSMSPADQIKFVDQLAFHDNSHVLIKEKIKDNARAIEDDIKKLMAYIDVHSSNLEDLKFKYSHPPEVPESIKQGVKIPELRKTMGELSDKVKESLMRSNQISKRLTDARNAQAKITESHDLLIKTTAESDLLTQQRASLKEQLAGRNVSTLKEKKFLLKKTLSYVLAAQELSKEQARFEELQRAHVAEVEKRKEALRVFILPHSTIQEMTNTISDIVVEMNSIRETISKFKLRDATIASILNIRTALGLKEMNTNAILDYVYDRISKLTVVQVPTSYREKCVTCPSCQTSLLTTDSSVHIASFVENDDGIDLCQFGMFKEYASLLEQHIAVLRDTNDITSTTFEDLENKLVELEDKKNITQRRIFKSDSSEEEYGKLELMKSNTMLDNMSQKISNQIAILNRLRDEVTGLTGDESEAAVTSAIEQVNTELTTVSHLTVKLEECETMLTEKVKQVNNLRTTINATRGNTSVDIQSLEKESSVATLEYSNLNAELESTRALLESLAEYEVYLKNQEEIQKIQDTISAKMTALKMQQTRLIALNTLTSITKEAEILAMDKTIETINNHARDYLDRMFDDPITVRLEGMKEMKDGKTKIQMNTVIDYKGHRYDSIDELSGGEKQRCELAFLLAINDMLGSKMLMLDECLNNLDSNVNTEVLTYLRELSDGKMMLVVSHEAVKGVFDDEVQIDHQ